MLCFFNKKKSLTDKAKFFLFTHGDIYYNTLLHQWSLSCQYPPISFMYASFYSYAYARDGYRRGRREREKHRVRVTREREVKKERERLEFICRVRWRWRWGSRVKRGIRFSSPSPWTGNTRRFFNLTQRRQAVGIRWRCPALTTLF